MTIYKKIQAVFDYFGEDAMKLLMGNYESLPGVLSDKRFKRQETAYFLSDNTENSDRGYYQTHQELANKTKEYIKRPPKIDDKEEYAALVVRDRNGNPLNKKGYNRLYDNDGNLRIQQFAVTPTSLEDNMLVGIVDNNEWYFIPIGNYDTPVTGAFKQVKGKVNENYNNWKREAPDYDYLSSWANDIRGWGDSNPINNTHRGDLYFDGAADLFGNDLHENTISLRSRSQQSQDFHNVYESE